MRVSIDGRAINGTFWATMAGEARYRKTATVLAARAPTAGIIETPEGRMAFEAGDYLVTDDPPTHCWPVKRDVFESTHEAIR